MDFANLVQLAELAKQNLMTKIGVKFCLLNILNLPSVRLASTRGPEPNCIQHNVLENQTIHPKH